MRKGTSKALGVVTGSLLLVLASEMTLANSKRVTFSDNGHVYQRIDGYTRWDHAQSDCITKKGHLATLTSEEENTFVASELVTGGAYYIGLGDYNTESGWEWVTGESFNFSSWYPGYPRSRWASDDYVVIGGDGSWYDTGANYEDHWVEGYICEWSKPISISTSNYPDINGDGIDESLILFYDYQTNRPTVYVYNMVKDKKRRQVRFGTASTEAKAVISLSDQTGDNWPEVAVLYYDNQLTWLEILDIKNNQTLDKLLVLEGSYKPLSLNLIADINGNDSEELIIQGNHNRGFNSTRKSLMEVRDSETGELINSREF